MNEWMYVEMKQSSYQFFLHVTEQGLSVPVSHLKQFISKDNPPGTLNPSLKSNNTWKLQDPGDEETGAMGGRLISFYWI